MRHQPVPARFLIWSTEGDAVAGLKDAILDAIRGLTPDDPPAPI